MKNDIALVRDEWHQLLQEKELELKKIEAGESLRLKNLRSDLTLQHQTRVKELESAHSDEVARLECLNEEQKQDYESRLAQTILITEHEQLLNAELGKATQEAQEKLG